jgi:hypothetical protein
VFRRNYSNSRLYGDISGGYASNYPYRGDSAFNPYPGSYNILENNVSENNGAGFDIQAESLSDGNQILGNISINDQYGVAVAARENYPINTIIRDQVVINPLEVGIYHRGGSNGQASNVSVIGSSSAQGIVADIMPSPALNAPSPSFFCTDCISVNSSTGFGMMKQSSWAIDYAVAYGNATNVIPAGSANYTHMLSVDPKMTGPYAFIPSTSALKGAGKDGNDIGANVLYRYQNGVLTTQPLWDATSGAFPCGAIIAGVNDVAGSSCYDINVRLNINSSTLPSSYSNGGVSAPKNLRITSNTP